MSNQIFVSILLIKFSITSTTVLESGTSYLKSKLDRNNIVNKGVWIRNKQQSLFERSHLGDFIFRPNSLNVDDLLDNNFYAFGDNYMGDTPIVSNYIERTKRSSNYDKKRHVRKSIKPCDGQPDYITKSHNDYNSLSKSKVIAKIKPSSIFNDYPYEVAVLLDKTQDIINLKGSLQSIDENNSHIALLNEAKNISYTNEPVGVNEIIINNNSNGAIPKRSKKNDDETKLIKKLEYDEEINDTDESRKSSRNIFDKDDRILHNYIPSPDVNTYKLVTAKPIKLENRVLTERGLIKVLSMLTKTFKKIIKQHTDIKNIHYKIYTTKENVESTVKNFTKKFQDFDVKYSNLMDIHEQIKQFQANFEAKVEFLKNKHNNLSNNLIEFENQQKKFLAQQRQFYNIQKLLLAQNEKINIKQNLITKTQSEISHRQNNFARILKKTKQIYTESNQVTKLNKNIEVKTEGLKQITHTTTSTATPSTTQSIKIDLFSIPSFIKLVDQDTLILKDKDEKPVDDIVYKYYFNNTFIDELMKNKVLSSFATNNKNTELTRNIKNKRNRSEEIDKLRNTVLLPVNHSKIVIGNLNENHRKKRWIRQHSNAKLKRKNRGKVAIVSINQADDVKKHNNEILQRRHVDSKPNVFTPVKLATPGVKQDPFLSMATKFCYEIGQNVNEQVLNWCVEKSLRRLKNIDMKFSIPPPLTESLSQVSTTKPNDNIRAILRQDSKSTTHPTNLVTTMSSLSSTQQPSSANTNELLNTMTAKSQQTSVFFPDNEELESNLKQYEIKPDTEGNFYYDGSLHASDIVGADSDGFSDLMPGLDSNSRVDVNPVAFDLQSRRRASVRRINENIMKRMSGA